MKKFITMLLRHWTKSPLKIILTLTAVSLGTGILILSLSASAILGKQVTDKLESGGLILYTANGEWNSEGMVEKNRPVDWDTGALDIIVSDIAGVTDAEIIMTPPFDEISTNGDSYSLRSAVGTGSGYFGIFSLGITAGVPMSEGDVSEGRKKVWISEEMAELLYGSAENAVGQWIRPPGALLMRGPGGERQQNMMTNYAVAGVFETPDEILRQSYGIGDLIFPYTSLLSSGINSRMAMNMMAGTFVIKTEETSVSAAEAAVRQVLTANYGDDIDIAVWEGSPRGESSYMKELRQTVDGLSVSINILGIVLLLTSSLGIFSIMVVEALGRRREIALERALGASRRLVVREFWSWSLALSLSGAVLGVLLSVLLAKPVLQSLSPLVGEVAEDFSSASSVQPGAVLLSLGMALGFGGILGLLPALSAVRGNISETIRDN